MAFSTDQGTPVLGSMLGSVLTPAVLPSPPFSSPPPVNFLRSLGANTAMPTPPIPTRSQLGTPNVSPFKASRNAGMVHQLPYPSGLPTPPPIMDAVSAVVCHPRK